MRMPWWTVVVPVVSLLLAGVALAWPPGALLATVCAVALIVSVLASVHHAEVVAHRVGAAVRAARADRLQTSLNLALGSALAPSCSSPSCRDGSAAHSSSRRSP